MGVFFFPWENVIQIIYRYSFFLKDGKIFTHLFGWMGENTLPFFCFYFGWGKTHFGWMGEEWLFLFCIGVLVFRGVMTWLVLGKLVSSPVIFQEKLPSIGYCYQEIVHGYRVGWVLCHWMLGIVMGTPDMEPENDGWKIFQLGDFQVPR